MKSNVNDLDKLGLVMMSRDKGSSWCTHGVHMYSGD